MEELEWRRSSLCAADRPQCVEVAVWKSHPVNHHPTGERTKVHVRSSHRPAAVVEFTRPEWEAFVEGVKAGEFDV